MEYESIGCKRNRRVNEWNKSPAFDIVECNGMESDHQKLTN